MTAQDSLQIASNCRLTTRRAVLSALLGTGIALCGHWSSLSFTSSTPELLDANRREELNAAIQESLDALARRQNEDGSFGAPAELFGRDPAVAALCGLAFLASGSRPNRGRYGKELALIARFLTNRAMKTKGKRAAEAFENLDEKTRRATFDYLQENNLSHEDVDGLVADFSEKGRKPTYGHGFATLFLAELLGTRENDELRATTRAAVDFIVRTQNTAGGWRYEPKCVAVADLSVTTCLLSALRSAHNAGLYVPQETISNAENFILSLQNLDGGFRYVELAGASGYSRTAAALHALQSGGQDASEATARAFRYLEKVYSFRQENNDGNPKLEYWSYGQFYAALDYWRAAIDEETRERFRLFYRKLTRDALARRGTDGLWHSTTSTEAETAFILCALSVPQEKTPFFLR